MCDEMLLHIEGSDHAEDVAVGAAFLDDGPVAAATLPVILAPLGALQLLAGLVPVLGAHSFDEVLEPITLECILSSWNL